jgi:hypothetical protein
VIRLKEQLAPQKGGEDPWVCGRCFFCGLPTRYWHEKTSTPVCLECGKKRLSAELPEASEPMQPLKPQERLKHRRKTT